jgi:glyoxylase-like metal-dependent hydrolase (beta-lactamase superfamily II)
VGGEVLVVKIETFPMGAFQVNTYLVRCEATGECLVIDPGDRPEPLLARLEKLGTRPSLVLNTHGHIDHVSGNAVLKEAFGCPVLLHPEDRFLLEAFSDQAVLFGLDLPAPPPPDGDLLPGQRVTCGEFALDVVHTPGHSPGSVSLVNGDTVFVGDVLFAGSIGRTDLPRGDLRTLLQSIETGLLPLGDGVRAWPGHGPATTLGEERRTNPYLQPGFKREILS